MFVTADQIVCHLVGDYLLQSDWMANEKTKRLLPAFIHAVSYAVPFLVLLVLESVPWTRWAAPLAIIIVTHALIDRFRLARYLCWLKNFQAGRWIRLEFSRATPAPPAYAAIAKRAIRKGEMSPDLSGLVVASIRNYPWSECSATGYHKDKPIWLTCWLLFIADNTVHLLINALALKLLT